MTIDTLWLILDSYPVQGFIALGVVVGLYLLAQWYIAGRKGAR